MGFGISGSILEGLNEILTVIRLGLPHELRRSLACTNIIENALGTVRQVPKPVCAGQTGVDFWQVLYIRRHLLGYGR